MLRDLAVVSVVCLLLVACYPTEAPMEREEVALVAAGEEVDVPLFRDALSPFLDEVARVPSGSVCALLGSTSYEAGHGLGATVTLYKVDCGGTVGWVDDGSVVLDPGASSAP